jgi:hypothetical protein
MSRWSTWGRRRRRRRRGGKERGGRDVGRGGM